MVIGNGLLSRAFMDYSNNDQVVVFASGVSNSGETNILAFQRELDLLNYIIETKMDCLLIYFSTTSIYDEHEFTKPYVQHKIRMEEKIRKMTKNHVIFRLSNVVGQSQNKNTIFNFLAENIKCEMTIQLWKNAYRNLIDIDHVVENIDYLLRDKSNIITGSTLNIGNLKDYSVELIVAKISDYLNKPAKVIKVERGGRAIVDYSTIRNLVPKYEDYFTDDYLDNLIQKYIIR